MDGWTDRKKEEKRTFFPIEGSQLINVEEMVELEIAIWQPP